MSKQRDRGSNRLSLYLFMILIAPALLLSCRRLAFSTISFPEKAEKRLELKAQILSDPAEIEQLFHAFLPDSGILPLQVGVRNNSADTLIIQGISIAGMEDRLSGFRLKQGPEEIAPLTPMDVISAIRGEKGSRYRRKGAGSATAGILLPPLGAYYIYDEATLGRIFRPLANRSFFETAEGFFFEPARLEPGEQRTGYLYFHVSTVPYARVFIGDERMGREKEEKLILKEGYTPDLELQMRYLSGGAMMKGVIADTAGFYDISFGDRELKDEAAVPAVILREVGGSGRSELAYLDYDRERIQERSTDTAALIDRLSSEAELAGSFFGRNLGACAVNFTRKSRVYLFRRSNCEGYIWSLDLERNILNVIMTERGVFAACDNGFCYFIDIEDGSVDKRYRKLARQLYDITLFGGEIAAFASDRIRFFSTAAAGLFDISHEFTVREGEKLSAGEADGMIAFMKRAEDTESDTLICINPADGTEEYAFVIPGKGKAWRFAERSAVWTDQGLLLKFEGGSERFGVAGGTFLQFDAAELTISNGILYAGDDRGVLFSFGLESMPAPVLSSKSCSVELSPPREKQELKRKRRR